MKNMKAFTVIELLIIIFIITILLFIVFVNINDIRKKSRDRIRVADISTIRLALEEYYAICKKYPESLNSINTDCSILFGDILNIIPKDPQTTNDYYYSISTDGFNYHIGAKLETEGNSILKEDHDFEKDGSNFDNNDFDGSDDNMIYDFRKFQTQTQN